MHCGSAHCNWRMLCLMINLQLPFSGASFQSTCPCSHSVLQKTRTFLARNMNTWRASGTMIDGRCLTCFPTLHTHTTHTTHITHTSTHTVSIQLSQKKTLTYVSKQWVVIHICTCMTLTFQLTLLPYSGWLYTYVHVWHYDFPAYIAQRM